MDIKSYLWSFDPPKVCGLCKGSGKVLSTKETQLITVPSNTSAEQPLPLSTVCYTSSVCPICRGSGISPKALEEE